MEKFIPLVVLLHGQCEDLTPRNRLLIHPSAGGGVICSGKITCVRPEKEDVQVYAKMLQLLTLFSKRGSFHGIAVELVRPKAVSGWSQLSLLTPSHAWNALCQRYEYSLPKSDREQRHIGEEQNSCRIAQHELAYPTWSSWMMANG